MSLGERIEKDFVFAYKNKAKSLVAALSMLKAATKNRQVELKRLDQTIIDQGTVTIKDIGRVIQTGIHSHKGRVDGKAGSELARTRLTV